MEGGRRDEREVASLWAKKTEYERNERRFKMTEAKRKSSLALRFTDDVYIAFGYVKNDVTAKFPPLLFSMAAAAAEYAYRSILAIIVYLNFF